MLTEYGKKAYSFYQKFHQNKINRVIHVATIPVLIWTLAFALQAIRATGAISLGYVYLYYLMDPATLFPMSVFWGGTYFSSYVLYHNRPPWMWWYVGWLHVLAWVCQFAGHRFFEGNRPALMESVTQAFVTAPLFVYYEVNEWWYT
tara:strand:+ start:224 stop:661 length:438 start_codon:yes stop_codon:yes gene_type:complete